MAIQQVAARAVTVDRLFEKAIQSIERGIFAAGGVAFFFGVPGVCDGLAMGHSGMHYSLPTRELIAGVNQAYADFIRANQLQTAAAIRAYPSDPAKRRSATLTDGPDRAAAPAMLKAIGFTDDSYQFCCTSMVWKSTATALRLLPALVPIWSYDPFLAYVDRWVAQGAWAQRADTVSADNLKSWCYFLASDEMKGRIIGRKAAISVPLKKPPASTSSWTTRPRP